MLFNYSVARGDIYAAKMDVNPPPLQKLLGQFIVEYGVIVSISAGGTYLKNRAFKWLIMLVESCQHSCRQMMNLVGPQSLFTSGNVCPHND